MSEVTDNVLRIVVPVDGSALADQAIAYAATVARPGDEVTLLHVAPQPEPQQDRYGRPLPMTDDELERLDEQARGVAAHSAQLWKAVLPSPRIVMERGDPAEHILAAGSDADLIVMASHGRGALGRWRYGSVTDRIARSSNVPVMVIRPQDAYEAFGAAPIHRFVVPLDGSPLAATALPLASRLAKRMHKQLHLVRVTPGTMIPVASMGAPVAESVIKEATVAAEHEAARSLEDVAAGLEREGIATTWDVEAGDAFERITAAAHPGDVIVLASHGRSGIRRWMLGSVAEKLVRIADAPVIVVRAQPGA
jgi:nucleotide-binding universal stress UspA family protein